MPLVLALALLLAWQDNSRTEDGFVIERARQTGSSALKWESLVTVPANAVAYRDAGPRRGWTYCYRVRAQFVVQFALSLSEPSNVACGVAP